MKPSGLLKINLALLVVILGGLGVCLWFLFNNKKDNEMHGNALAVLLKKFAQEDEVASDPLPLNLKLQTPNSQPVPSELSNDDWFSIYAISDKLFSGTQLNKQEKSIYAKFESYVLTDLEFLKQLRPIVEKLALQENQDGLELTNEEQIFYEANKDTVDQEVEHRKKQSAVWKSQVSSSDKQQSGLLSDKPATSEPDTADVPTPNSSERSPSDRLQTPDLTKSNPPLAKDKRNEVILSLFLDGIPKTAPQLHERYKKATGHDYGKNWGRVLGSMEGKFLTPIRNKGNNKIYYALPEWFDGKKLKEEYKKIA
jgi:hypothetical protein